MKNKGITLIALVVTIVVLLILSAITIYIVFGDNGILSIAMQTKIKTEQQAILETLRIRVAGKQMEDLTILSSEIKSYLIESELMNEDGIVNVSNIMDSASRGKGNLESGDYYKIEDGVLYYVGSNKLEENIGEVFVETETITDEDIFTYADENKTILTGVDPKYVVKSNILVEARTTIDNNSMHTLEYKNNSATVEALPAFLDTNMSNFEIKPVKLTTSIEVNQIVVNGKQVVGITIPNQVVEIRDNAFSKFINLQTINLSSNLTKIGSNAFDYCISLTKMEFPNTLTQIEKEAFSDCNKIKSITLPKSVTKLGECVFWGWKSTQEILVEGKTSSSDFEECNNDNTFGSATVRYLGE